MRRRARTRLDTEERRSQLLRLGVEHFGRVPYDDVSIDDIASAAGISKGLLYHYFPTKKAFYAATVRAAAERLVEVTAKPSGVPPAEQLTRSLDAYLDFVREHAAAYATLMRSGVGVDPQIARIVDDTRETFVERLAEAIRGLVPPSGDGDGAMVDLALRGWVGMCEHVSLAWTAPRQNRKKSVPTQRQVRDLLAKALMSLLSAV
jgi:AcrR family transcriptional regulator